jgi:hypothetical protein
LGVPDPATEARWLLVEWRTDGSIRYALSSLPATATLAEAVGVWKTRWQVEQGYQQLKEELGLDHFEGRFWPGFHHHAALCFLAYGFLAVERARGTTPLLDDLGETDSPFANRHPTSPQAPSPPTDAARHPARSQRWLEPPCPFDCAWCRSLHTSGST